MGSSTFSSQGATRSKVGINEIVNCELRNAPDPQTPESGRLARGFEISDAKTLNP